MALSAQNYSKGFLIDEELMAGVTAAESEYSAFVLRHTTGEYLGYRAFPSLEEALASINAIPRPWKFESTSGCSGERCGEGKCKGEGCKIYVGGDKSC
jgi:hypothetical protein